MPLTEAKKRANKKWDAAHPYDRLSVFVPQGGKEQLKGKAAAEGESVNEYVNKAITARMGEDWRREKKA